MYAKAETISTYSVNTILFLTMFMAPLVGAGIDLYSPSLPAITTYFDVSGTLVRYSMSIYLLGYAVGQIIYGPLSDSIGRRKVLIVGLIFYVVISFFIAMSPNITFLLIMRLLQGLAIASVAVVMKAILIDSFSGKAFIKSISYMAFAWALGPIVAPIIGGYIQHFFGWKMNFIFLTCYGAAVLTLVFLFLPETNQCRTSLNIKGVIKNFRKILLCKFFIGATLCMALGYSMLILFNVIGPFLIQDVLKYQATDYGHIALVMGTAFFIGTIMNRLIINKIATDKIIKISLFGMFLTAVVMFLLALANVFNIFSITIPIFILLFGVALILPNCAAISLNLFPKLAGSASALSGCLMVGGTVFVTGIAGVLKADNPIPMSISYVVIVAVCFLIYVSMVSGAKR